MLIRDGGLGAALAIARACDICADAWPRVGRGRDSLKQVVYRAIYAEVNARLQAEAARLGSITFLNEQEAGGRRQ